MKRATRRSFAAVHESGFGTKADIPQCPLLSAFGAKADISQRCLPIAIYEYTPQPHARCETGEIFKVPRSSAIEGG
jgi:hypothetical protein